MLEIFTKLVRDPVFWATSATIILTIVNVLLFLINRRTFKLLYEKPRFEINVISVKPFTGDGAGGIRTYSFLDINFVNPSSFDNLIVYSTLKNWPFGPIIEQSETGFKLPKYQKIKLRHELDYESVKNYKNKWVKLTITDIKGSKVSKKFKLIDDKLFSS